MIDPKVPFPLNKRYALLCLLMMGTPLAIADTKQPDSQQTNASDTSVGKKEQSSKSATNSKTNTKLTLDEMVVKKSDVRDTPFATPSKTNISAPSTKVRKDDIDKTNAVTTADSVKYESGVFARQRYIGDPNAPIGMRGSNPYQAGRVMVFMDGLPIWNPLQSSYNGSPRWGLIGPGEIKSVEVIGGPFSAEYSGNAMGGVINYTTLMPQKREIYTEATYMLQPYNSMGTNTNLQGFKTFGSYGDKFGDFSTYFSYNHLENEGQPMTPTVVTGITKTGAAVTPSFGALNETNPKGNGTGGAAGTPMLQTGSDGIYHSVDDLYKWKGAYDINAELKTSIVAAFEDLDVTHQGQSLLTNAAGQTVWGSQLSNYNAGGYKLVNNTSWGASQQNRQTVTLGWALDGRVFGNWYNNTNISYFDVLNDTTISSSYNPQDPTYSTTSGQVGLRSHYTGTGWVGMKSAFNNDEFFGNKDLSYSTGFEYQRAHLTIAQENLSNYGGNVVSTGIGGGANALKPVASQSGGTTNSYAWFNQLSWRFMKDWDATPGIRFERWNMENGTYLTSANMTGSLNPQDREVSNWAPKFSLGFQPGNWKFRYSVAKAYRYPVADELFGNSSALNGGGAVANATLKPEDGTHHNLLGEYDFDNGYVRLNLFHENIRNAIYTQYIYAPGSATLSSAMSSIGEVETNGIDLSTNFDRIMNSNFDFKLNTTILNSQIISNPLNPSLVGNQMPLMPNYRVNQLTTYHYGKDLDLSVGTRYQSAMNSQPDNKDTQATYYGAFNESVYVDLKSTYYFNEKKGHVSAGIDNINGYVAFYNHPLPLRTFFAQVGYKF